MLPRTLSRQVLKISVIITFLKFNEICHLGREVNMSGIVKGKADNTHFPWLLLVN